MVMHNSLVSRLIVALAGAGAMLASCGTVAEIYKWVDQKGVTNYSGTPQATGKARTLDPGVTTVSVYPAPPIKEAARALDALLRRRVAMLEEQLQAERLARLSQQVSSATDADLAREQCLRERRVDCDTRRDGMAAIPHFYAAPPVFVVRRPFLFSRPSSYPRPLTPRLVRPARFAQPAGASARGSERRRPSRKHR